MVTLNGVPIMTDTSTSLTTAAAESAMHILAWETKSGKSRTATSPIQQATAPTAVRVGAATATQLEQIKNGRFGPTLTQCRETLTTKEIKAIVSTATAAMVQAAINGDTSATAEHGAIIAASNGAVDKRAALAFARATIGAIDARAVVALEKGKEYKPNKATAALYEVLQAWLAMLAPVAD
jgi:hypothetical protein